MPQDLKTECKAKPFSLQNLPNQSITSSTTTALIQQLCNTNKICIIEKGVTVTMNSNLNVAALVVKGNLIWNDQTMVSNEQWLCAGYVAVKYLFYDYYYKH